MPDSANLTSLPSRGLLICTLTLTLILALAVSGLLSAVLLLSGQHGNPINLLQTPGASITTLLTGAGMLSVLGRWQLLRMLSGGLLALQAVASLALAGGRAGLAQPDSPQTTLLTVSPLPAVYLLLIAACLLAGYNTPWRRRLWIGAGAALSITGLLGATALVLPQLALADRPYASHPLATTLFALITGVCLISIARHCQRRMIPAPQSLVIATAAAGALACCLLWVALVWQQQGQLNQRAAFLLDNLEFRLQRTTGSYLLLMRRMAERLDASGGTMAPQVLERDLANYLRDNSALRAIGLVADQGLPQWVTGRNEDDRQQLNQWLQDGEIHRWLAANHDISLYAQSPLPATTPLLAINLPGAHRHLVTTLDLPRLIADEILLPLPALQVVIRSQDRDVLRLVPHGVAEYDGEIAIDLGQRQFQLTGGLTLDTRVLPLNQRTWQTLFIQPSVIAGAALLVSWLFTYCVGLAFLERGRSRELLAAQAHMQDYRNIQELMIREAPLQHTLEAICQTLEQQLPGALCSVMLKSANANRLELKAGASLPDAYRQAIAQVDIGPEMGACGTAAFLNQPVICPDLATDPLWTDHQHLIRPTALRACWSWPVRGSSGEVLGTFAIYRREPATPDDVATSHIDRASALVALAVERVESQRANQLLRRAIEASVNGVVIVGADDPDMPITYVNPAFLDITGYEAEELIGRNCRVLQGPDTDPATVAELREGIAQQREIHVTLLNYRKDGEPFWNELFIAPVRDSAGQVSHFVGIQQDVTRRKAYEEQLAHHAHHDALTGLPNRTLLEDRLSHDHALAQREGRLVAVLFVDLDEFKPINDTLGHAVGDLLLKEVARRLAETVRAGDTVARLGGDEFVVVLPRLEREDLAMQVAERLLVLLAEPYRIQDYELFLSATIGIALSRGELRNPLELIQQADMAMYKAKEKGRNDYQFFTEEFTGKVRERVAKRNALQGALSRDELEMHYQPLFDREDRLVGVEGLLRWNRPGHGYVSPAEFIPLAESTGQIIPISEWVLERACRDMESLRAQGLGELRLAVNLSPIQFQRANFLPQVKQTLLNTGFASRLLDVELTERILMDDQDAAIRVLQGLKAMDIGVAIDDFGTGYSSLSYLRVMPIDKIKIDQSFTRDLTDDDNDRAIVAGIIAMAHHLGFTVVAEGVETEAQWRVLMELGCDQFQGYLKARPMPLVKLRELLAATGG